MELETLRIGVTVLSFVVFVGILFWAFGRSQKAAFDEAAHLPFLDSDEGLSARAGGRNE